MLGRMGFDFHNNEFFIRFKKQSNHINDYPITSMINGNGNGMGMEWEWEWDGNEDES